MIVLPANASNSYCDGDRSFAWSSDGRWLAVMLGYGSHMEIGVADAAGAVEGVNISLNGFSDAAPAISADGKVVLWMTGRFGLRADTGRIESSDIYAAFLTPEAFAAFSGLTGQDATAPQDDAANTETGPNGPFPDLSGIEYRSARLSPFSEKIAYFKLGPDNRSLLYVVDQPNGTSVGYRSRAAAADRLAAALWCPGDRLPPQRCRFFENMEVQPDVLILNNPESIAAGRDPQLEGAVETLLGLVDRGRE
ncbi:MULTISPECIES: PD40 domain-containing protein [Mameliella]|uniref:Uncharacterized protein n=1 Tax=Mameliella alba TaxID=561184 RepID=A0A0B3RTJ8_9RHOB|nr:MULTISPECIES: PD40 domain-containing protein [Mameliella]KHQ50088.1 hypothetical protein OA50_05319 [Mameliella alba]